MSFFAIQGTLGTGETYEVACINGRMTATPEIVDVMADTTDLIPVEDIPDGLKLPPKHSPYSWWWFGKSLNASGTPPLVTGVMPEPPEDVKAILNEPHIAAGPVKQEETNLSIELPPTSPFSHTWGGNNF